MSPFFMDVNFKNQLVRDLAWAIKSPSLLRQIESYSAALVISDDWFNREYNRHLNWLLQLDKNPSDIEHFFNRPYRLILGKYAEELLHYFFLKSPFYRLLMHSLQIKKGNRVVGELDFLIQCLETKKVYHIEFAVKFFLNQINGNSNPKFFKGPNGKDTLNSKLQRLRQQLNAKELEQIYSILKQNGFSSPIPTLITKGYFFYQNDDEGLPFFSNLNHNRGLFFSESSFSSSHLFCDCFIYVVPKMEWLSWVFVEPDDKRYKSVQPIKQFDVSKTLKTIGKSFMVAILKKDAKKNYFETQRAFIVKDSWPNPDTQ
jgi:hypothetical protein